MGYSEFSFGLLICFLLSFILGIERQYRRRSLGLRTMILIAIGSYLFVSFSFLLSDYNIDATRIASQVVAGIGFFGAGVILKDTEKNKVRGLTTAATMWCDAAIGVLCAGGFIEEAVVATLFVLFANIVLRYINHFINDRTKNKSISEVFNVKINSDDISKISKIVKQELNQPEMFKDSSHKELDLNEFNADDLAKAFEKLDNFKLFSALNKLEKPELFAVLNKQNEQKILKESYDEIMKNDNITGFINNDISEIVEEKINLIKESLDIAKASIKNIER